jgi:hypothetical protein
MHMHGVCVRAYVSESKRQQAGSRTDRRESGSGRALAAFSVLNGAAGSPIPLARLAYLRVLCEPAL